MILYYAAGGGLGHLTRARAVIHTLGITDDVTVLTASPFAVDERVVARMTVRQIPQDYSSDVESYRSWLAELLAEIEPAKIFLDTFPCGILGEFRCFDFPDTLERYHIARGLRWAEYEKLIGDAAPEFRRTYVVEPLETEQERYLKFHSTEMTFLQLTDPPLTLSFKETEFVRWFEKSLREDPRPCWLIVHAGSGEEIAELLAYAREMSEQERINPRLIVIAPEVAESKLATGNGLEASGPGLATLFEYYHFYPASALFRFADRIITACGYNTMRQTESFKDRHRFLPMARRFDNQFLRAARRRAAV
jgi:predicted glycosyltransferase